MSESRKSFRVAGGNVKLTVYPWTHPRSGAARWRFGWRGPAGWRYVTRQTKAGAREAAEKILADLGGPMQWEALAPARRAFLARVEALAGPADEAAVIRWLESRGGSAALGDAVERYLEHKRAGAGGETRHLANVRVDLTALAVALVGRPVGDVTPEELAAWIEARAAGAGPARRRAARTTLVGFWRWCRRQGLVSNDTVTAAERLPAPAVPGGAMRILTPRELLAVLAQVDPEWRAWVALGAFAGLRPEEIAPLARWGKPGLAWEHFDWDFGVIRLPAAVAKVRRPRIVPILPALSAWLDWAGVEVEGPVCPRNPSSAGELRRLAWIFGGRWPADCLRHSYGSYRNAVVRSLEHVAEEMGSSVAILHRHYHNPRAAEEGSEWFDLRPADLEMVPMRSDETGVAKWVIDKNPLRPPSKKPEKSTKRRFARG